MDLFNGGEVPIKDGKATLRLAAGDGACWVELPQPVKLTGCTSQNDGLTAPFSAVLTKAAWLPARIRYIDADGKPKAMLNENAGTTAYRLTLHGGEVLLGRMNRTVQRVKVQ